MKKTVFFLFALLMTALSWQGTAQVTVGDGTLTQRYPLGNYWGFERSAAIYTSDELVNTGAISTVEWEANIAGFGARPIKIYLKETTATAETTGTWASKIAGATLVYDGSMTPIVGWNVFNLTTAFPYTGNNLEVLVEANFGGTGNSGGTGGNAIRYTSKSNSHIYWTGDNSPPTSTGTLNANRPNIRLDLPPIPGCSGTPIAGIATIDPSSGGGDGAPVMVSASGFDSGLVGLTYLWEYSFDDITWTPVGTASSTYSDLSATVNGNVGDILAVRLAVSCINSGETSYSNSAIYTVIPAYCTPSSTNISERLSAISSNGAVTNITYSASTRPLNGYEDKTSLVFETYETQIFTMSTTYVGGTNGVNIWVDWNGDMVFDASEIVAGSVGPLTQNFSIEVPAGTPQGDYRMRVRGQWNALPPACGSVTYGSAVDFTLTLVAPPSCLQPTALTTIIATSNTADISWTPSGSESSWNISWGTPGYFPGDGDQVGTDTAATESYQITGLTAETDYDYYVQAVCGTEQSFWSGPISFTTACAEEMTPWTDNVEGQTGTGKNALVDGCWTANPATGYAWNVSDSNTVSTDTGPSAAHSGSKFFFTEASNGSTGDVAELLSPLIDVSALTTPVLSFYYHMYGVDMEDMNVYVFNGSAWNLEGTLSGQQQASNAAPWEEMTIVLSGYTGIIQVKFEGTKGASWNGDMAIDDISITEAPSCIKPTDLVASAITATTADISWTDNASVTDYTVKYGTPGFDPETEGTSASATATGVSLSDLTANTAYQLYSKALCGRNDESEWSGPLAFRTDCGAATGMFEDFDSYPTGSIVPECWERMAPATSAGSQTISSTSPASGNRNIYQYTSSTQNAVIVALPEFSNIDAGTHWLKLQARVGSGTGTLSVGYVTDISDYDSFTLIEDVAITNTSYGANSEYTVVVPNTVPAGARLGIKSAANGTSHYWDDVSWEEVPSCFEPTALVATGVTETTADIGWTAGASESSWNISWGTPGYTPGGAGQLGSDTALPTAAYQITGLAADTYYDVRVQADCGVDGESTWSAPLSIYTGYCIPSSTSTSDYLSEVSSNGAFTDISYTATSMPTGGYSNQTLLGFESYETQTFDITTNYVGGSNGVKIWVDWNNNMVFDESELMGYQVGSTEKTFAITIPAGTPQGDYRMRVRGQYGSTADPAACGSVTFGSAIDFTLTLVAPPSCLVPTALEATDVTANTADINWTPSGSESSWNISWGTPGYTPGGAGQVGSVTAHPTTTFQITGLTSNTDYDFSVQANCGPGDESVWVTPMSFTTLCSFTTVPYVMDFETATVPNLPNCTSRENVGTGNDWVTASYSSGGFSGKVLKYGWHGSNAANAWFYTQGVDLVAGTAYQISYRYGNNSISWAESMKVAYGTSPVSSAMTNQLADYPAIQQTGSTVENLVFTVPSDGVYYFGFNAYSAANLFNLYLDDVNIVEATISGFVYANGAWSPSDPNTNAMPTDDITVINGVTSFTDDIEVNSITVLSGATLNVEGTLTFNGDITNNGDLVFVSTATGNGELAAVNATSSITGNATVQRYMKDMRSYRMVSSAVTTSSSIHANWQEGATGVNDDPNPGFGTHITGSTTGQNGFDATATGNASMFIVDVPSQQFQAVGNTDVNTLIAGNPYLLFVRGDRGIDMNDNLAHSATVLRATGSLVTGDVTQSFTSAVSGNYIMFGNPYQSAVDLSTVFGNAGSSNLDSQFYHVYDPTIADHGAYVIVDYINGLNNNASSFANQYLQPGQGAQVQVTGPATVAFTESDKAPGNFTSSNRNPMSESNMLAVQLYTTENFNNEAQSHDAFMMFFADGYDNGIAAGDAVKSMNFYENLAIDHQGTYLGIERRAMPQAAEVYPLYTNGYNHSDYTLKLTVDGLENTFLYLDDHFTGTSLLLEAGDNAYSFSVDANQAMSVATERFSIRTEQRLGVDDNSLLAGIRLFPNPLNGDTFYINAPKLNGEQLSVNISDLTGRSIYEQTLDCRANTVTVPMGDNMASGVYLVTLKHGGESNTYRLIKE